MNGGPDPLFVETLKRESLKKYPSWIVSGLERKTDLEEKFFEEERNCKTVNESVSGLTSLSPELEGLVFVLCSWLPEPMTECLKLVNLGHLNCKSHCHPFVQLLPVTFFWPQAWT